MAVGKFLMVRPQALLGTESEGSTGSATDLGTVDQAVYLAGPALASEVGTEDATRRPRGSDSPQWSNVSQVAFDQLLKTSIKQIPTVTYGINIERRIAIRQARGECQDET